MEPLIRSGLARKLSFTGSTQVGRLLLEQCAEKILRTSLELGGNAPFIVFEDAELDEAVEGAIAAKMRNMGEACTAANRMYVHSSVIDEFGRRLAERMAALPVGRGTEDGVTVGPLIDEAGLRKVQSLVADAVERGATVLTGGSAPEGSGFFYPPTVLTGVPREAKMADQEIFGPVAPLTPFDSEAEVIAAANDTEYGLVSYVFTNDLRRALRVAEALETGMVGLNQGVVSNPAAPVRWDQAVRPRPRGRRRRHRRIFGDEVHRHRDGLTQIPPKRTNGRISASGTRQFVDLGES